MSKITTKMSLPSVKRTDLDMLCKSTEDSSEVASGIKERMNVYGLVMALLLTMTWSVDGPGLEVSEVSLWKDANQDDKASILSWYKMCLYLATTAFMLGILSVVEILDRTAVTPLNHSVRFFLATHDAYTHLPNFFMKVGVHSFAVALLIQASVSLPAAKCIVTGVLLFIGMSVCNVQKRHGINHNRAIVDEVVSQQSIVNSAPQDAPDVPPVCPAPPATI